MRKVLKYGFFDLMRSKWSYIYFLFYLVLTFALLFLSSDLSRAMISLMNVIIILCPLIGTMFGVMYFYNSREFTQLLLAQPIKRSTIFLGQYLGLSVSLSVSLCLGMFIPFSVYGLFKSHEVWNFLTLIFAGTMLTFIFSAVSFLIALRNDDKIKGFGLAIFIWLFLAVIYDGLFLLALVLLNEYPLESFSMVATMLNPIDLARILILLKLDVSALMSYTGAVFQKFFGSTSGLMMTIGVLLLWVIAPVFAIRRVAEKKDL